MQELRLEDLVVDALAVRRVAHRRQVRVQQCNEDLRARIKASASTAGRVCTANVDVVYVCLRAVRIMYVP